MEEHAAIQEVVPPSSTAEVTVILQTESNSEATPQATAPAEAAQATETVVTPAGLADIYAKVNALPD